MTTLIYKPHALIEDLQVGECTMHRASGSSAARWWQLWFRVARETDGQPQDFCVPMNPNGSFTPSGPGGKTWGLTRVSDGLWQVAPSINVHASGAAHEGPAPVGSLWHQTPLISGVPNGEPWANGIAP